MLSPLDPSLLSDCLLPPLLQPPGSAAGGETPRGHPRGPPLRYLNRGLAAAEPGLLSAPGKPTAILERNSPTELPEGRSRGFIQEIAPRAARFFFLTPFLPKFAPQSWRDSSLFRSRAVLAPQGFGFWGAEGRSIGAFGVFPLSPPPTSVLSPRGAAGREPPEGLRGQGRGSRLRGGCRF